MTIRPHALLTLPVCTLAFAAGCASTESDALTQLTPAERIEKAHDFAAQAAQADDPIEAQRQYLNAIDAHGSFAAAWNNLAVLLLESSRNLEADEAFAIAASVDRRDPRPVYNRGLLRHRIGQLAEARALYAEALERDRNYLPALAGHIETEVIEHIANEETIRRIDHALRLASDPKIIETLRLQRLRINADMTGRAKMPESQLGSRRVE